MTHAVASRDTTAWRGEIRATLLLAWPLVLTNLSQMALATTDVVLMGWLGPSALAAGALATNLNFAFLIVAIGLVTATSPMIAIELGRRRHSVRDVRRSVRQGLWAGVAIVVPIWIVLWYGETVFLLLGQDPDVAREGGRYLRFLQWSVLPFVFFTVLRNFVAALERPMYALVVAIAAIPINAILVWALIFGRLGLPELGLPGAGIGTTVTNIFMFLCLAIMLSVDRKFRRYHLFGRFWRADWQRFRDVWRIGLPIAATLMFEVTIFNAAAFLMGVIGPDELAAHAIAINVAGLAFMVPLGVGMAATVRVGLALGRGDREGITRAGWTAFWLAVIYSCATAAILLLAGRPIVGIFLDLGAADHQHVIALAVAFLGFAGIFQLGDAGQAAALGMLRGLGDTRVPMILAALGYWGGGLSLSVLLAFYWDWGGTGIWIGLVTGLFAVAVMLTFRWSRREVLGLTARRRLTGLEVRAES